MRNIVRKLLLGGAAGVLMPMMIATTGASASVTPSKGEAKPKPKYVHATTLKTQCKIYENILKAGVPERFWTQPTDYHVGVRYTTPFIAAPSGTHKYSLILDTARSKATPQINPHWGFIDQSCLKDPYAYSMAGQRLPDLQGVDGHGNVKAVALTAAHAGKKQIKLIHADSVGTLRDAPRSFVIGNVRAHDPFYITTAHCGQHAADTWILGYAPNSERWGYVEASHLPACR